MWSLCRCGMEEACPFKYKCMTLNVYCVRGNVALCGAKGLVQKQQNDFAGTSSPTRGKVWFEGRCRVVLTLYRCKWRRLYLKYQRWCLHYDAGLIISRCNKKLKTTRRRRIADKFPNSPGRFASAVHYGYYFIVVRVNCGSAPLTRAWNDPSQPF